MAFELLFLFIAGLLGGIVNTIAGGGSFITFPALIFVGLPPISANATNTFASCAGYMSGAYAYRKDLSIHKSELVKIILISLIGGIIGAWILLNIPPTLFQEAIPWLLLFSTILFIYGVKFNTFLKQLTHHHRHVSLLGSVLLILLLLAVSIYGGFFNAGLGIIILSYFALAGYSNLNKMNGLKLLMSSCISFIAILLFIYDGLIVWYEGAIVLIGSLAGGYIAASVSRKVPQQQVRGLVMFASISITLFYFIKTYQ